MLSVAVMRQEIKDVYSGTSWEDRVDKMRDSQIAAIHQRMREQGKLLKKAVKHV